MQSTEADGRELRDLLDGMRELTLAVRDLRSTATRERAQVAQSHINVNAGGVGLWIAVTACFCTLLCSLGFAVWTISEISRLHNTDDVHTAYINNIIGAQKK